LSGERSGAKAMGLWLIAVRKLQYFSERLKKFVSPGPKTIHGIEIVRFLPSLLQPHLSINTKLPIYYGIRIE
jgi:hypothetical protein